MCWRCFGKGIAAMAIGSVVAILVDQVWPLVFGSGLILALIFIVVTAWWGAHRSTSLAQGARQGALTLLIPAAFWTLLFNAIQYEWGGRQALNIDHLNVSLFLLGFPLTLGAAVGATIGLRAERAGGSSHGG